MEEVDKTTKPQDEQTTPSPAYKSTLGAEVIDKTAKLHKQPRGLLKTAASTVGKDTDSLSLFSLQTYDESLQPSRETISRNTAITGQYLMALWQKNKDEDGIYKIKNLSEVAKPLNVTPQELKNYLIYLSGYIYPVTTRERLDNGKTRMYITNDLLFKVRWSFLFKDGEDEKQYNNDKRVGTRLSNYIKDLPVESVEITPNKSFIEELEGRGLGNILVSDEIVAFSLNLTPTAYKLFCLSGSNRPTFKIGFKKLVGKKYLNLESLLYGVFDKGKRIRAGKGKPYVLTKIKEALEELKQAGHLQSWNYEDKDEMFSWTYTDKIYKHEELYTYGDKGLDRNNNKDKKRKAKKQ